MSAPDARQLDGWCAVLGLRLVEVSRPPVLAALAGLLRYMGYAVIPSEALTRIDRDLTQAWMHEHGSTARELLLASATGALAAHVALTPSREDFADVDVAGVPVRKLAGGGFHQGCDGTAHPLDDCTEECTPP